MSIMPSSYVYGKYTYACMYVVYRHIHIPSTYHFWLKNKSIRSCIFIIFDIVMYVSPRMGRVNPLITVGAARNT